MKKGILIVSFGTTHQETREKNIEKLADTVGENYPDYEIWQAYSSNKVRSILKNRDGIKILDVKEALEQMKKSGVEEVILLPTHIIDGYENHKIKEMAEEYRSSFKRLCIAGALLEKKEDFALAAKALWDSIVCSPLLKETKYEIVIFMGHGTHHEADLSYEKMEQALQEYSQKEVYIATVEGSITIEDVVRKMKEKGNRKKTVLITPFMLVAGDHAVNDMAGEKDSFKSKVEEEGYEAVCLLSGLGEYEKIRDIYMKHLKDAMKAQM